MLCPISARFFSDQNHVRNFTEAAAHFSIKFHIFPNGDRYFFVMQMLYARRRLFLKSAKKSIWLQISVSSVVQPARDYANRYFAFWPARDRAVLDVGGKLCHISGLSSRGLCPCFLNREFLERRAARCG